MAQTSVAETTGTDAEVESAERGRVHTAQTLTRSDRPTVQGTERIRTALAAITNPATINHGLVAAGVASWLAFAALTAWLPNSANLPMRDVDSIARTTGVTAVIGVAVAVLWVLVYGLAQGRRRLGGWARGRVIRGSAWFLGAGLWAIFWEFTTAKTALLEPPYFAAPQQLLERLWSNRVILAESLGNSLGLLALGFGVGLLAGLLTGVTIGWIERANYWVHPILVFIGPVPTLAWVPIVFVLFPSAWSGAIFLIALSVWFPITVLTRAGVLSVPRSYYDVARTLGASPAFLVRRIALPSSLPSIFTGAFMALGASFVSLTVAENFGVNSGLGWYLNWKKGWGDYPAVYAGIVVLVVVCGFALTLLFRVRGWVLRWEKELTRW